MRRSRSGSRLFASGCVVAAAVWSISAGATPVQGVFGTASGALSISNLGVTGTAVFPTGLVAPYVGTTLNTGDLNFAAPALANFVTFQANPTLRISLASVAAGAFSSASCGAAAAGGQTCSPGGALGGLNFINTPTGAVASLTVTGSLNDSVGFFPPPTSMTGVVTFQFLGKTYQQVLATIAGGGTLASTYSAEYASADGATTFSIGGGLSLSATGIDFGPTSTLQALAPGQATIGNPVSGSFNVLVPGSSLMSQANLSFVAAPTDAVVSLMNFLTFPSDPGLTGELTTVMGGAFGSAECLIPAAIGQACTFAPLPFMFSNVPGGSVAALSLSGLFHNGPDADAFLGLVSFQFTGVTYQQVLALIASGQSVPAMYSASFGTDVAALVPRTVPESASLALVGMGLAGLALSRRIRTAPHRERRPRVGAGGSLRP